jgi:hypothetical protein
METPITNFEQIPVATVKKIAHEFSANNKIGDHSMAARTLPRKTVANLRSRLKQKLTRTSSSAKPDTLQREGRRHGGS